MRIISLFSISLILMVSCERGAGELVVEDGGVYNFNKTTVGDTISHTFTLINKGGGPIKIEGVQAICACVATLKSDSIIPAKGHVRIKTVYVSRKNEIGMVDKLVILRATGAKKMIQMHLQGRVARPSL